MLFPLFLLMMLATKCVATKTLVCDNHIAQRRIEDAIQEAIKMAKNAGDQINNLDTGTTEAAFRPLFRDGDVTRLQNLYSDVVNIDDIDRDITFYCEADFIMKVPYTDGNGVAQEAWSDTHFTYQDSEDTPQDILSSGLRVVTRFNRDAQERVPLRLQTMPTGEIADFSKQTHIHVNSKRWEPPPLTHDPFDHRALDFVNRDGLYLDYVGLDTLKPLSETIFHELMHALGGLAPPANRRAAISDNPVPPIQLAKIYGYEKCVWMNENRDHVAAISIGATPLTRADCPTILAKALYLQIQGRATYWSTGVVDATTLRPAGIKPPPSTSKRRISRIARRVWGQVI